MSKDLQEIRVIPGTIFFRLKVGKTEICKSITLDGLEAIVRKNHAANKNYLTAIDIRRTKQRGCQSQKA